MRFNVYTKPKAVGNKNREDDNLIMMIMLNSYVIHLPKGF